MSESFTRENKRTKVLHILFCISEYNINLCLRTQRACENISKIDNLTDCTSNRLRKENEEGNERKIVLVATGRRFL